MRGHGDRRSLTQVWLLVPSSTSLYRNLYMSSSTDQNTEARGSIKKSIWNACKMTWTSYTRNDCESMFASCWCFHNKNSSSDILSSMENCTNSLNSFPHLFCWGKLKAGQSETQPVMEAWLSTLPKLNYFRIQPETSPVCWSGNRTPAHVNKCQSPMQT